MHSDVTANGIETGKASGGGTGIERESMLGRYKDIQKRSNRNTDTREEQTRLDTVRRALHSSDAAPI